MALGYCLGSIFANGFDPARRKKSSCSWDSVPGYYLSSSAESISMATFSLDNAGFGSAHVLVLYQYYKISALTRLSPGNGRIRFYIHGPDRKYLQPAHEDHLRVWPRANVLLYHSHLPDSPHCPAIGCFAGTFLDRYDKIHQLGRRDARILKGYGLTLSGVYIVWISLVAILYPVCKKYDRYKSSHKDKWWLSYL